MPRFSKWFKGLFRQPGYKFLSLMLALGTWLYVQGKEEVDAKIRASIDWSLPEGLLTTEPLPPTLTLSVSGSRSAVRRANRANVSVVVDMTQLGVGDHTIDFSAFPVKGLQSSISLVGYAPFSITRSFDEVSVRQIQLRPVTVGEAPSGYRSGRVELEPSVIEVRGPRGLVLQLEELRTLPIDISTYTSEVELEVELDLPRAVHPTVLRTPIRAHVHVEPIMARRTFEGVTVVVRRAGWFSQTAEVSVELEGPADLVRELKTEELTVLVHLPDTPKTARLQAELGPTEGLRVQVIHPDMERVNVIAIEPPVIGVVRR